MGTWDGTMYDMASDLRMELLYSILSTKSVEFHNGLRPNDLTE
jgi:hypothetical protein